MKRTALCWSAALGVAVLLLLLLTGPSAMPAGRANDSIRVVTANLYHQNDRPGAAAELLAQLDADVLIMLEWTGKNLDLETLERASLKPILREPRPGTHGICVLARGGLEADVSLVPSPVSGPCRMPFATMRLRRGPVVLSLIGVHVPPPVSSCRRTTGPTIEAVASWVADGRLARDVGAARKGDPVLLVGDFNALPMSSSMDAVRTNGLVDAYDSTNWRPGPTWSPSRWLPPVTRIDYIFAPAALTVHRAWVLALPGSDHRLVMAEFLLGA